VESERNKLNKIENKLLNDAEFVSKTKKGIYLIRVGKFIESEQIFKELISKSKFDHSTLHWLAGIAASLGKNGEYVYYLKEAVKFKKDYGEAYAELGNYYKRIGQINNALNYFHMAVKYRPNLFGVYINIGNIFVDLGRNDEALNNYKKALEIKNDFPSTFYNIANIFFETKKFEDAKKYFLKALTLDKNHTKSKIGLINIYLETFDIKSLKNYRSFINNVGLKNDSEIGRLMTFFYLDSSPKKQYLRALYYSEKVFGNIKTINKIKIKKNKKIRVGYLSANFNDHPVLKIMESVFKNHDKNSFEIYAYNLHPGEDESTKKVKKYFQSFKNIAFLSLKEMIKIIRSDELDIAVDLMGYTKRNKIELFNTRIAPIQINYLGFAGTTGLSNMDFLIADKFIISKKNMKFYSEKILYMPNSFINSIQYQYSNLKTKYKKLDLPPKSFLLAAFHRTEKLSEEVIDSWISILRKTDNTYLWLSISNEIAKKNLISFFQSNNVDIKRILFAEKLDLYSEHISRYAEADLFLDTFFYNGHTTILECIWSELPFITLAGESFASRVGLSIANSLGLPELVANSLDEYIEKVIFYTKNLDKLSIIKNQIRKQKNYGDFFNQKLFVKQLEEQYLNCINSYK
jgi:predicted O-linked N-acetylglucosamine transferase (SPINDLY family)